jgi:hypothetical protein
VNENHAKLLGTPEWAAHLHEDILPAVTCGIDLGDDMLKIGPARVVRTRCREGEPCAGRGAHQGREEECVCGSGHAARAG